MSGARKINVSLDPFPQGWYVVEAADRIGRNQHISKTWMGKEIIAWRDAAGTICVADAVCPHLGAHLGPESGGFLKDGKLVCPFHGFEYDISGKCVKATAGPAPPSAKLNRFSVQEINGYIFAYHDPLGRKPEWFIPDVGQDGWADRVITKCRVRSHPQITSENSVDFAHLSYLHGYENLKQVRPTEIEGPFLTAHYAFDRTMLAGWLRFIQFHVEIDVYVWGLGVSTVIIKSPDTGLVVRQWVLATPIDGVMIDVWLAADIKSMPHVYGLNLLPERVVRPTLSKILVKELASEVALDAVVWGKQEYRPNPVLCQADRDIFRFRRYCKQFYPEPGQEKLRVVAR